jgi:hypothetical protein
MEPFMELSSFEPRRERLWAAPLDQFWPRSRLKTFATEWNQGELFCDR